MRKGKYHNYYWEEINSLSMQEFISSNWSIFKSSLSIVFQTTNKNILKDSIEYGFEMFAFEEISPNFFIGNGPYGENESVKNLDTWKKLFSNCDKLFFWNFEINPIIDSRLCNFNEINLMDISPVLIFDSNWENVIKINCDLSLINQNQSLIYLYKDKFNNLN